MELLNKTLENLREKLIDVSNRNKLINFNHSYKKRCVRVIDELPNQLAETLLSGKEMTFVSIEEPTEKQLIEHGYLTVDEESGETSESKPYPKAEEWAKILGFNTSYVVPDNYTENLENKHSDTNIQTLFYKYELETILKSIFYISESSKKETGANILYFNFGFLRWKDSENSKSGIAPLYSIPVSMTKGRLNMAKGIYEYTIKHSGTDIIENLSLREKLKRDFALALPEISEKETPESYMQKIENLIKGRPSWKIERYITLGLLDFTKSLMYRDLDPANWSSDKSLLNNELVKQILTGVDRSDSEEEVTYGYADDYSIDNYEDEVHDKYPLLFDADSSQHSAIIDVVNGKNMVIEGPPGTGKSQTITNLVGSLLKMGKSVLFMAEKQAALDVVHEKLKSVGLEDFCLNIHGKADKKSVIESIGKRIKKRGSYKTPAEYLSQIEKYENLKNRLNEYEEVVNSEWKDSGFTVNKILTAAAAYRESVSTDIKDTIDFSVVNIDKSAFDKFVDELETFATLTTNILGQDDKTNNINHHPWKGFTNDINSYQVDDALDALSKWTLSLNNYETTLDYYKDKYSFIEQPKSYDETPESLNHIKEVLNISTGVDFDNLHQYKVDEIDLYERCISSYKAFIKAKESLQTKYSDDLFDNISSLNKEINIPENARKVKGNLTIFELEEVMEKLEKLENLANDFHSVVSDVNKVTQDENISTSLEGIDRLNKVLNVVKKIKFENISYRDLSLNNQKTFDAFKILKNQVIEAKDLTQKVSEIFELDMLPENHILESLKKTITEEKSFKWLRSDYRNAKKQLKEYISNPYAKIPELINAISDVKRLRNIEDEMNQMHQSTPLSKYVAGIATDISRLEDVIEFYKNIEEKFGTGFGEKFKTRDFILKATDEEIQALQNIANINQEVNLNGFIHEINEISSKLGFQVDKSKDFLSEEGAISLMKSFSNDVYEFIKDVAFLGQKDSTFGHFLSSIELVNNYLKERDIFDKLDANIFFKSDIFLSDERRVIDIEKTVEFIRTIQSDKYKNEVSKYVLDNLSKDTFDEFDEIFFKIEEAYLESINSRNIFNDFAGMDITWFDAEKTSIQDAINRNEQAIKSPEELDNWIEYLRIHKRMQSSNLHQFCDYALKENKLPDLANIFRSYVFNKLAIQICKENEVIEQFSSNAHDKNITDFVEVDHKLKVLNQDMVASSIDAKTKTVYGNGYGRVSSFTEMALLSHEMTKQTRHAPLRSLISRAKSSLMALKPCFMMSPMSVSQYLKPGDIQFDVVIMDEASQIKPEDAIGSIARGAQVVIVGDPKQLPPTSFFDRQDNIESEEETVIDNQESILDAAMNVFDLRTLKWHYRSRHEDLIQFSNLNFYKDNLIVFPSPINNGNLGIRHIPVTNGVYMNRKNIPEARKIAEHVRHHLIENKEESLGIVAMNSEQQKFIESAIEDLERSDEQFSKLLNESYQRKEPLFIKNLENVQGDERDVMFISTTYGPESEGGRVMQRFGLRARDGHRRLNVLLTRAKMRMHVFTSLRSSDVSNTSSNRGVRALNKFLKYCETGQLDRTETNLNKEPDSDFEIAVMNMLERHNFECVPQVGAAGFFIDIAVKDPNHPGEFLMGIECDGATYHSSNSARDRDRLRQQVLEGLGWNIKRIWSTDWFRNPQRALEPIIKELKELRENLTEKVNDIPNQEINEQSQEQFSFNKNDELLEMGIKEKLEKFNNDEISVFFPKTDTRRRLLSPRMIELFASKYPTTKSEYLSEIPEFMREVVDKHEENKYLTSVLDIISNDVESGEWLN